DIVDTDERLVRYIEDSVHGSAGRSAIRLVDLLDGDVLLQLGREVDYGDVGSWHAHGHSVDQTLHLWQDQCSCLGRASRGRDDGDGGGAGAAEVLVREVEDLLVV